MRTTTCQGTPGTVVRTGSSEQRHWGRSSMDRRIGIYVENVPASMTKCVFCRRHAHRAHFSPRLLVLKSREVRALVGVWKKRTSSQTWIQNHKALVNSLGDETPLSIC
ncbi:hypothetical protein FOZG_03977 [Fusarium oxysporum Fo47]|uniref:Uncharacterized protein n=1 Tax=Fusarium oxysporum Fo47 TaxID=660027 RepID=W9L587_FUSOX|nr:hypothetical protein FOZG_03977 [Fusarium oxysporum Fo47]